VQESPPAQKLLDWLERWDKSTVRVRDICIYGPISMRDRETAVNQARNSGQIQLAHWLIPIKPRRRDSLEWQIVRVHPTVAALSPTVAT
jgi:hypothetical protein